MHQLLPSGQPFLAFGALNSRELLVVGETHMVSDINPVLAHYHNVIVA